MIDLSKGISATYPFPYTIIEDCFDEDTLNKLIKEFPNTDNSPFVMGGRNQMENSKPHIRKIIPQFETWIQNSPTWKQFYNSFSSDDTFRKVLEQYTDSIEKWQGVVTQTSSLNSDCYLHIDWSSASDGYVREIHTDSRKRVWNFLIFLNDKEWDGGDFVIHSSDDIHTLDHQIWNHKLPVHRTIEAKKNLGIFFLSTPDSYHSVTLQSNTKTPRQFIYGSYSYRQGSAFKLRQK